MSRNKSRRKRGVEELPELKAMGLSPVKTAGHGKPIYRSAVALITTYQEIASFTRSLIKCLVIKVITLIYEAPQSTICVNIPTNSKLLSLQIQEGVSEGIQRGKMPELFARALIQLHLVKPISIQPST